MSVRVLDVGHRFDGLGEPPFHPFGKLACLLERFVDRRGSSRPRPRGRRPFCAQPIAAKVSGRLREENLRAGVRAVSRQYVLGQHDGSFVALPAVGELSGAVENRAEEPGIRHHLELKRRVGRPPGQDLLGRLERLPAVVDRATGVGLVLIERRQVAPGDADVSQQSFLFRPFGGQRAIEFRCALERGDAHRPVVGRRRDAQVEDAERQDLTRIEIAPPRGEIPFGVFDGLPRMTDGFRRTALGVVEPGETGVQEGSVLEDARIRRRDRDRLLHQRVRFGEARGSVSLIPQARGGHVSLHTAELLIRIRQLEQQLHVSAGVARDRFEIAHRVFDERLSQRQCGGDALHFWLNVEDHRVHELSRVLETALLDARLPDVDRGSHGNRRNERRRRRGERLVSAHEFGERVDRARRARKHRPSGEQPIDVCLQLRGGRVTCSRLFRQRLENDGVEISWNGRRQAARRRRREIDNTPERLFERRARAVLRVSAGGKLVQQYAQRVYIGCERQRLAPQLLRTCTTE